VSEVRFNFLNYNPDTEDTENQGLSVAQNVVHDTEGYKPVHLGSAGSFATTGGLAASAATVTSIIAKPVGDGNDLFCAWIAGDTLHVGLNGVTAAAATTGYPVSFATTGSSQEIVSFDVTELAGKIFFAAQAQQSQAAPVATATLTTTGYMDY